MDSELLKWILGGIGTAVVPFSGWAWKQRQAGLKRERDKDLLITTLKVAIAISDTKLAAYQGTVDDGVNQIDALTERIAHLLYAAEKLRQPEKQQEAFPPPWPYPRKRPTAVRRPSR